jgi:hypothetical protein
MLELAAVSALKAAISLQLGVGAAHLHSRFDRLVANVASSLAIDAGEVVKRLAALSLREICLLLAEGPTEQTRALLAPEQVHPVAHQGLAGHDVGAIEQGTGDREQGTETDAGDEA